MVGGRPVVGRGGSVVYLYKRPGGVVIAFGAVRLWVDC